MTLMSSGTTQQLELDKVLHQLARRASTHTAAARAQDLDPRDDLGSVLEILEETSQARDLLEKAGNPPLGGITEVHPLLTRAARGGTLDGKELLQIFHVLGGLRRFRDYLDRPEASDLARLRRCAVQISALPVLEQDIDGCLDSEGIVKDTASEELRRLRSEVQRLSATIQTRVKAIATDPRYLPMLQESLVTSRNGRFCVPVKVEFKGEFKGIVHDRSGSGATLFVEPMEVMALNNQLRELLIDEQDEIERILKRLTLAVAGASETIDTGLVAAFQLDLMFAKGKLSLDWDCHEPRLNSEGRFVLLQARHPLLHGKAVPVDVSVGQDFNTLLITGANTGGKTVALKTVGLLTLMARCGLHLPADPKSEVSVGGEVFCDIGDEQNLETDLSTFSAHLVHVIDILQRATTTSLVLLDELGTGTDPEEGAALAMALLSELTDRGARTVATTHHGSLKSFVHLQEKMENAAVEFDSRSLRPTYRIEVGLPGNSQALTIARRLGMPEDFLNKASGFLSTERIAVDQLIDDLEMRRRLLESELGSADLQRERLEAMQEQLESEREALQKREVEQLANLQAEGRRLMLETREEADKVLRALRSAERESAETEKQRQRLRQMEERLSKIGARPECPPPAWDESLEPGQSVRLRASNRAGVLLSLPDSSNEVEVRIGNLKVRIDAGEIEPLKTTPPPVGQGGISKIRLEKALSVTDTIDLHGYHVEEALAALDRFLDDAILGELDRVQIIHGIGTGRLRKAIHEYLTSHPAIEGCSYADPREGGAGTTVARLQP